MSENSAMRKAGLTRSRSRRKAVPNGPGTPAASNDAPVASSSADGGQGQGGAPGERRKPTQEEAALTAKNYRLAKELSELRVRHRDESKTVTRLTMENMNLASRCREAISHVAMLKKELAMHQRRAAEALALQRQQSQRMSDQAGEGTAPNSASVAMEMVLSSTPPPPPPPLPKEQFPQPNDQDQEPTLGNSSAFERRDVFTAPSNGAGRVGQTGSNPLQRTRGSPPSKSSVAAQKSVFDSVSEKRGHDRGDPEMRSLPATRGRFTEDVPADEMLHDKGPNRFSNDSLDFFSSKNTQPLPVTPEKESDADEETPSSNVENDAFQTPPGKERGDMGNSDSADECPTSPLFPTPTLLKDGREMSSMSSIDAFEASFDTAFPASFSAPTEDPPPSLDIAFDVPEFSDPFFLGSLDGGGGNSGSPFLDRSRLSTSKGNNELRTDSKDRDRDVRSRQTSNSSRMGSKSGDGSPSSSGIEADHGGAEKFKSVQNSAINTPEMAIGPGNNPDGAVGKSPPIDLFPASAMSTFEQFGRTPEVGSSLSKLDANFAGDHFFQNPPSGADGFCSPSVLEVKSPPRPDKTGLDKTGAAEARARYDAAFGENLKFVENAGTGSSARPKVDQQHHQPQQPKSTRDPSCNAGTKSETNHSSSLVLKRLQQRRVRDKGNSSSGAPFKPSTDEKKSVPTSADTKPSESVDENTFSASHLSNDEGGDNNGHRLMNGDYGPKTKKNSTNPSAGENQITVKGKSSGKRDSTRGRLPATGQLLPDTMGEEMRQLDAIANASSSQAPASSGSPAVLSSSASISSRQRRVRQPVSYAEPALNSKLRRGDVFFPKKEAEPEGRKSGDQNSARAAGSSSPASDPANAEIGDLHPNTSADDVLKDLAGSQPNSATMQL